MKKIKRLLFAAIVLNSLLDAQAEPKSHRHGRSSWHLTFNGLVGKLVLEVPGESLFGFEHEAKKPRDIKKINESLHRFENHIEKMIEMPTELKCQWKKIKLEVDRDEDNKEHCDVEGEFEVFCPEDPQGKTVVFYIQKYFPRMKKATVEFEIGNVQKSITITKSGESLSLK